MRIEINGEGREVAEGSSVADLLAALGLNPARVAVERNRAIVPRSTFAAVPLTAGDRVELVEFVGGG